MQSKQTTDSQPAAKPDLRHAPEHLQTRCTSESKSEYPMQVYKTRAGHTPGCGLERGQQQVKGLRGCQIPQVGDLNVKLLQLAVQQTLIRVGIAGENQDSHRPTS